MYAFATLPLEVKLGVSGTAGIASHLLYFMRGEHHMNAPIIVCIYTMLSVLYFIAELNVPAHGLKQATIHSTIIVGGYVFHLFLSMTVYRVFFHRLHPFPGPLMATITKFWHVKKSLKSQNHLLMNQLHAEYGDFVRTGEMHRRDWSK